MADDQIEQTEPSENQTEDQADSISLDSIKEAIDELYTFRDNYYVKNPSASEGKRNEDVEVKLKRVLQLLEACEGALEKADRARFHMLKGKALNIREDYSPEAHEALSRAVKLNPKLAEAWNELGECYWKQGQTVKARNCFEGILKVTKDKVSLRNLSMVLRQVGETEEEKLKNICDSVTKAKEALELDIEDGKSWSILGNAYMAVFFSGAQKAASLQQAMTAYSRAEDYQKALEQLEQACSVEPHWNLPREKAENLRVHLKRLSDTVSHKGNLKPRRIRALLQGFKVHRIAGLEPAKLRDLSLGKNPGRLIAVKVACSVLSQERYP
ncbi:hypothetical protein HPB48_014930 [Haemaphysalis longicornis]|uniref:Cell division cycle protein 27 homolog n=1 Tax=Haemaphysalis longicornis TaxID=44386 RepID=A0A9J6FGS7_HAELO|nr:hypothetical protein HPB48_014930 [Haemaphysalis longicornis]